MALAPELKIIAPWKDPSLRADQPRGGHRVRQAHRHPHRRSPRRRSTRATATSGTSRHEGRGPGRPRQRAQGRPVGHVRAGRPRPPTKPEYVDSRLQGRRARGRERQEAAPATNSSPGSTRSAAGTASARSDLVENRLVGIKSRGAYETPGGTILYEAHRALESITLDRETLHYKQQVALKYADMVYYGQWFCPLREALDAFVDSTQKQRHRHGAVQALQGPGHRRRVTSPKQPLQRQAGELHHGQRIHAHRRHRLHQALRPADAQDEADRSKGSFNTESGSLGVVAVVGHSCPA